MPFSYVQYTGNGSTTTYSVPFPYLLRAHVKLYYGLNLVSGAYAAQLADSIDYAWSGPAQVQINAPPPSGAVLTIRRETPTDSRLVDWNDGSGLNANDLDTADLQNFYAIQEHKDLVGSYTRTLELSTLNDLTISSPVNKSLVYFDASSGGYRIDSTITADLLTDGGNY